MKKWVVKIFFVFFYRAQKFLCASRIKYPLNYNSYRFSGAGILFCTELIMSHMRDENGMGYVASGS